MWHNQPCGPASTPARLRIIAWSSTPTVSACYRDVSSTMKPPCTDLIRTVKELADGGAVQWAIDLNSGGAALLITLLLDDDQELLYIPGRTVHHASAAYRGDGKTDAKDAAIIADQARMRRDLHPFRHRDKTAVDLRILCARRTDLASDRNRAINRLRAQLLEYFPALERAFDFAHRKAALTLLTGYQTPDGLRRMGTARLERWLRDRHAYNAGDIAARAIEAANAQRTTVIGQDVAASVVARLAQTVLDLNAELVDVDAADRHDVSAAPTRRHHHQYARLRVFAGR